MSRSREEEYRRRMKEWGYDASLAGMDDEDIEEALARMDRRRTEEPDEYQFNKTFRPPDRDFAERMFKMFARPFDPNWKMPDLDGPEFRQPQKPEPAFDMPRGGVGRPDWGGSKNLLGQDGPRTMYRPGRDNAFLPSRGTVERTLRNWPGGDEAGAVVQPMSTSINEVEKPTVPGTNIAYPLRPKNIIWSEPEGMQNRNSSDPLPEGTIITSNDAGANISNIEMSQNFPDVTQKLAALMAEYEEKYKDIKDIPLPERLIIFNKLVKDYGILDLKRQPGWDSSKFIYNGEVVNYDVPGNILYGYLGKHFDIPDTILYAAAGGNHMENVMKRLKEEGKNPLEVLKDFNLDTFGDDPRDTGRIRQGVEMWNKKYPPQQTFVLTD